MKIMHEKEDPKFPCKIKLFETSKFFLAIINADINIKTGYTKQIIYPAITSYILLSDKSDSLLLKSLIDAD